MGSARTWVLLTATIVAAAVLVLAVRGSSSSKVRAVAEPSIFRNPAPTHAVTPDPTASSANESSWTVDAEQAWTLVWGIGGGPEGFSTATFDQSGRVELD